MPELQHSPETRQRLLEAAGAVFAEHGFHDTTIREISLRAEANVAAVNYHFGDKAALYRAVFDYARNCAGVPQEERLPAGAGPAEELYAIVHAFLQRFFAEGRPAWLGKLAAREMTEPTKLLDSLVEERIRPTHERLKGIARELLGPTADEERLRLAAFSIAAQYQFYFHCQTVVARLCPELRFGPAEIERLARHITDFSLAALREGW